MPSPRTNAKLLKDIAAVEALVDNETRKQNLETYNNMKPVIDLVQKFIIKNQLVVYGGLALNDLLPSSLRFYDEYEIPDYDCYSSDAMAHSMDLADLLFQNGYQYVEVRQAVHEGTYRVYCNFMVVADVTQINHVFYKDLVQTSKAENNLRDSTLHKGVLMAPVRLLKFGLYKELSRPRQSLFRWTKVFKRSILFNKYYKPDLVSGVKVYNAFEELARAKKVPSNSLTTFISTEDKEVDLIVKDVFKMFKKEQYPLVGNAAFGIHMGVHPSILFKQCCRLHDFFSIFEILTTNTNTTFEKIKKVVSRIKKSAGLVGNWEVIHEQRYYHTEILPTRIRVYLRDTTSMKYVSLATLFNVKDYCFSYVVKNGIHIGSIYTIITFYYAYSLLYKVYESEEIQRFVMKMVSAIEIYLATNKLTIDQKLVTQCYGNEKTIESVKRSMWTETKSRFLYRPNDNVDKQRKTRT